MPVLPPPGGTTLPWWTVWYNPAQNQVSSRYVNTPAPGQGISTMGYVVLQAANTAAAIAAAKAKLGTNGTVTTADGPFTTQAQAQADGKSGVSQNQKAQQPGITGLAAIGDFFARLGEASTWIRVGEVILGVVLVSVGIAKMTNAIPAATKIAGYIK